MTVVAPAQYRRTRKLRLNGRGIIVTFCVLLIGFYAQWMHQFSVGSIKQKEGSLVAEKSDPKTSSDDTIQGQLVRKWGQLSTSSDTKTFQGVTIPNAIPSKMSWIRDVEGAIVLATHLSGDKLERLAIQLEWWQGPASAAIYVSERKMMDEFFDYLQLRPSIFESTTFHFAMEKMEPKSIYPHNVLRNLALDGIPTGNFFVALDVDFIPSWNAHDSIRRVLDDTSSSAPSQIMKNNQTMFVLPAFEALAPEGQWSASPNQLPKSREDLIKSYKVGSIEGFHLKRFPKGHSPTRFDQWMGLDRSKLEDATYPIDFPLFFEPYVMGYRSRNSPPRYWPTFRGYGYNKLSWFVELKARHFRMQVLRDAYVVHLEHPQAPRQDQFAQRAVNQPLWQEFLNFIEELNSTHLSPAQIRRLRKFL